MKHIIELMSDQQDSEKMLLGLGQLTPEMIAQRLFYLPESSDPEEAIPEILYLLVVRLFYNYTQAEEEEDFISLHYINIQFRQICCFLNENALNEKTSDSIENTLKLYTGDFFSLVCEFLDQYLIIKAIWEILQGYEEKRMLYQQKESKEYALYFKMKPSDIHSILHNAKRCLQRDDSKNIPVFLESLTSSKPDFNKQPERQALYELILAQCAILADPEKNKTLILKILVNMKKYVQPNKREKKYEKQAECLIEKIKLVFLVKSNLLPIKNGLEFYDIDLIKIIFQYQFHRFLELKQATTKELDNELRHYRKDAKNVTGIAAILHYSKMGSLCSSSNALQSQAEKYLDHSIQLANAGIRECQQYPLSLSWPMLSVLLKIHITNRTRLAKLHESKPRFDKADREYCSVLDMIKANQNIIPHHENEIHFFLRKQLIMRLKMLELNQGDQYKSIILGACLQGIDSLYRNLKNVTTPDALPSHCLFLKNFIGLVFFKAKMQENPAILSEFNLYNKLTKLHDDYHRSGKIVPDIFELECLEIIAKEGGEGDTPRIRKNSSFTLLIPTCGLGYRLNVARVIDFLEVFWRSPGQMPEIDYLLLKLDLSKCYMMLSDYNKAKGILKECIQNANALEKQYAGPVRPQLLSLIQSVSQIRLLVCYGLLLRQNQLNIDFPEIKSLYSTCLEAIETLHSKETYRTLSPPEKSCVIDALWILPAIKESIFKLAQSAKTPAVVSSPRVSVAIPSPVNAVMKKTKEEKAQISNAKKKLRKKIKKQEQQRQPTPIELPIVPALVSPALQITAMTPPVDPLQASEISDLPHAASREDTSLEEWQELPGKMLIYPKPLVEIFAELNTICNELKLKASEMPKIKGGRIRSLLWELTSESPTADWDIGISIAPDSKESAQLFEQIIKKFKAHRNHHIQNLLEITIQEMQQGMKKEMKLDIFIGLDLKPDILDNSFSADFFGRIYRSTQYFPNAQSVSEYFKQYRIDIPGKDAYSHFEGDNAICILRGIRFCVTAKPERDFCDHLKPAIITQGKFLAKINFKRVANEIDKLSPLGKERQIKALEYYLRFGLLRHLFNDSIQYTEIKNLLTSQYKLSLRDLFVLNKMGCQAQLTPFDHKVTIVNENDFFSKPHYLLHVIYIAQKAGLGFPRIPSIDPLGQKPPDAFSDQNIHADWFDINISFRALLFEQETGADSFEQLYNTGWLGCFFPGTYSVRSSVPQYYELIVSKIENRKNLQHSHPSIKFIYTYLLAAEIYQGQNTEKNIRYASLLIYLGKSLSEEAMRLTHVVKACTYKAPYVHYASPYHQSLRFPYGSPQIFDIEQQQFNTSITSP